MTPNANEIARQARIAKAKVEEARLELENGSDVIDLLERAVAVLAGVVADAERLSETLRDLA